MNNVRLKNASVSFLILMLLSASVLGKGNGGTRVKAFREHLNASEQVKKQYDVPLPSPTTYIKELLRSHQILDHLLVDLLNTSQSLLKRTEGFSLKPQKRNRAAALVRKYREGLIPLKNANSKVLEQLDEKQFQLSVLSPYSPKLFDLLSSKVMIAYSRADFVMLMARFKDRSHKLRRYWVDGEIDEITKWINLVGDNYRRVVEVRFTQSQSNYKVGGNNFSSKNQIRLKDLYNFPVIEIPNSLADALAPINNAPIINMCKQFGMQKTLRNIRARVTRKGVRDILASLDNTLQCVQVRPHLKKNFDEARFNLHNLLMSLGMSSKKFRSLAEHYNEFSNKINSTKHFPLESQLEQLRTLQKLFDAYLSTAGNDFEMGGLREVREQFINRENYLKAIIRIEDNKAHMNRFGRMVREVEQNSLSKSISLSISLAQIYLDYPVVNLKGNAFQIEAMDPMHRYFKGEQEEQLIIDWIQCVISDEAPLNFFRYMEENHRLAAKNMLNKAVHYVDEIIEIQNSYSIKFDGSGEQGCFNVVTNGGTKLVVDPNKETMFVVKKDPITRKFRLLVDETVEGHRHHSGLANGRPVAMAGTISINNEGIIILDNRSGHYKPTPRAMKTFIDELYKELGADFGTEVVDRFFETTLMIRLFTRNENSKFEESAFMTASELRNTDMTTMSNTDV